MKIRKLKIENLTSAIRNLKRLVPRKRRKLLAVSLIVLILATSLHLLLNRSALAAWSPTHGDWAKRKQLTITNDSADSLASGTAIAISIDTKTLYELGKLQEDCDDIRIVYQPDSSTYTNLDRYLSVPGGASCGTNGATKVHFQLQATLASAADSTDYYIYYDNDKASAPANSDNAFDIGSKNATLVCPFDGSTTCAATETPSTETGAIRYSGEKSALSFDGKNDYMGMGSDSNIDDLPLEDFTAEYWLYIPEVDMETTTFRLLEKSLWTPIGWINQGTRFNSARRLTFDAYFSSTNLHVTTNANAYNYDEWTHVAFTFNAELKRGRIFVNGTEASYGEQRDGVGTYQSDAARNLEFSRQNGSNLRYFAGTADEIRVSNILRYTSDFTPQTEPFVRDDYTKLLLHFDENGDDPRNTGKAIDDSGNGNHATITGAEYVAGLVGVNNGTTDTGKADGGNAYAGQEGIFIEEATTNKITNPSFEHSTYDTNWTASASATISENTSIPFYKFGSKSAKVDASFTRNEYDDDQSTTSPLYTTTENKRLAQGFQISSGASPTTASLYLEELGSSSNYVRAEIQTDSSGVPSNTPITNGTSNCLAITSLPNGGTATWQSHTNFTFSTAPSLTASTQYHLVLRTFTNSGCTTEQSSTDSSNYARWRYADTGTYSNGDRATADESDVWTTQTGDDFYFSISETGSFLTSINAGNTNTHTLSAYVYAGNTNVDTIDSSVLELMYDATPVSTTYTDMGGGWWRLTYSAAGINASTTYGVEVKAASIVYFDGVQLEEESYATTYTDGSLESDSGGDDTYFWDDDCDGTLDAGEDETADQNTQCSSRTAIQLEYDNANFNDDTGAVSLWYKPNFDYDDTPNTVWPRFFGIREDSSNIYILNFDSTSDLFRFTKNTSSGTYYTELSTTFSANEWIHLVATWDTTSGIALYVNNGTPDTDANTSAPTITTADIQIGSNLGGSHHADGTISDYRIYDDSLTTAEIADLYQAGLVAHSEQYEVDRFSGEKGQDPVAIWHFDESYGSTANDSSKYGNSLTLYNSPSWNTDSVGARANLIRNLEFDGTDDIASRSADLDFNFGTDSFSISGWFRHPSSVTGTDTILARYEDAGYKVYMNSSGYICAAIDDDSTWTPDDETCSTSVQGSYADSKWHHFEMVKDEDTSLTLYIDAQRVNYDDTIEAAGSLNSNSGIFIGADSNNSNYWTGFLDEIVIYPYARTADQVKADVFGSQTSALFGLDPKDWLSDGLVGYWKMDEADWGTPDCSTDVVFDSSGNNFDGDACPNSTGPTGGETGKFGNGVDFDGSDDYLLVADNPILDFEAATEDFSIFAWVRRDSDNTEDGIVGKKDGGGDGYELKIQGVADTLQFRLDGIGPAGSTTITDTNWHHVGVTIDRDGDGQLYLDGEPDGSPASMNSEAMDTINALAIGATRNTGENPFDGAIDEARIYNRALSPSEVADLYLWAPGPVAYYPLDEGTGTSVSYDRSGNDNNLSLSNMTESHWISGKFGSTIDFAHSSAPGASASDSTSLSIEYDTTLAAWIKPETTPSSTEYVIAGKWEGSYKSYLLTQYEDEIRMYIDSSSNYETTDAANLQAGNWYHVEGVYSATGQTVTLYVNGVKEASTTTGTIPSSIGDDSGAFTLSYSSVAPENLQVSANDDDGSSTLNDGVWHSYGNYDNSYTNTVHIPLGGTEGDADVITTGLRFTSVDIPKDANITGATLDFMESWGGNYSTYVDNRIYASDESSCSLGSGNLPSSKTKTSAYQDWDSNGSQGSSGQWYQANATVPPPDITNVIQEIVNRGDWTSGNDLCILIEDDGSSTDWWFEPRSYESGSSNAAKLDIEYGVSDTPYDGLLDDVRVYNYARTPGQIVEDMNAGHPAPGSPIGSAVAYWSFDEGYGDTANDSGTGGNNGNLGGATSCPGDVNTSCPAWTNSGKFGKAVDFETDGTTDDYIEIGSAIVSSYPFTMSAWVNPERIDIGVAIMSLANSGVTNQFYTIRTLGGGAVRLDLLNGGESDSVDSISSLSAGNWYHIVGVFESSTNRKLYINSVEENSSTTSVSLASGVNRWNIGRYADSTPDREFDGKIDEVKIYNFALTADQVKIDMNQGRAAVFGATGTDSSGSGTWSSANEYCPPGQGSSCTAPIAEWKFDEKINTSAFDTSENNNTGTIGNADWQHAGNCKEGACLYFDGIAPSQYINAGSDSSINNLSDNAFTIEAWIKPDGYGNGGAGYFFRKDDGGPGFGLGFATTSTNGLHSRVGCATTDAQSNAGLDEFTADGEWHHVVMTFDDAGDRYIYQYIDGKPVDSYISHIQCIDAVEDDSSGDIYLGNDNTSLAYEIEGNLDAVRIFDYVRTPAQIAWSYNRGAPLGHWQLDECEGLVAYDIGSGGNNGTITIGSGGTQDEAGTCSSGDTSHAWNNGTVGKVNYSLDFDGNDDYVSIGDIDTLEVPYEGKLTIAAWVNRDTFNSHDVIYSKTSDITSGAVDRLVFYISAGDGVVFIIGDGGNTHIHLSNREITQSGWYHVVVVFENTNESTIYINGVADDSGLGAGFSNAMDNSDAVVIGAESDGDLPFSGQIDDVRVYNYALTRQQILDVMNQGAVYFGPSTGAP